MKTNENAIEIKNLYKKFGKQDVLANVNLSCEKGQIVGIAGKNGSGKTVLLKCICNLLLQDSGEIYIEGIKNTDYIKKTKKLGAVIEAPSFLENYNGFDNLAFLYGILNPVKREHIYEIMRKVGLDPTSNKLVSKYSLGMKQKLAIAQAIMEGQKILILDEPMNGLDSDSIIALKNLLSDLKKQQCTIVMASHYKEDIRCLCDKVYYLNEGKAEEVIGRENIEKFLLCDKLLENI